MAYTFKKRVGPTSYDQVKNLKYYVSPLNPPGFSVNPDTGGNCTWWAWGRFLEVMSVANKSLSWNYGSGNACKFYDIMTAGGLSGGLIPKPGAIICWGYDGKSHGEPGHVAFVEAVNSDGSIEISHSGHRSGPLENETLQKGNGTKGLGTYSRGSDYYFNGFIYNPVDFGNPLGVVDSSDNSKSKQWYISEYGTGAEVYFELIKYGYSHKACCAVLGNMQQESGIKVYTGGSYDGNGSEGLCQWTFSRKTAMQKYAAEHSVSHSWKSVDGQVAYLVYELEHSEKSANEVLKNNSLSLEKMTEEFEKAFERAGVPMMDKRISYAKDWDKKMAGASTAGDSSSQDPGQSVVDMTRLISTLYSSDNFIYIDANKEEEEKEPSRYDTFRKDLIKYFKDTDFSNLAADEMTGAIPEVLIKGGPEKTKKEEISRVSSTFNVSDALVQAPFVEISLGGYTIGSYKSALDDYPNYISQLDVKKINGEINQYTIGLVHQIRAGEDPNLLDKLFSIVRYNNISIRYGDCQSGSLFKDSDAIITNIVQNRDYTSSKISYTLYATSVGNYVANMKFNFKATKDRPSNVIRSLLYSNNDTSALLLEAFPKMKDKNYVEKNNLIPSNDAPIYIEAKTNMGVIAYINYLVGCMSSETNNKKDVIRNSLYFITYTDDKGGAAFKINEVSQSNIKSVLTRSIFEVTIGYPGAEDIYDFRINNNESWAMLYNNTSVSSEYVYGIDSNGNMYEEYSPNLVSSSNILNEIQKNWWTQMVSFPISAQLKMKGLLRPVSLMDYVQVNVMFYGQKHITSGLYTITGQEDSLSGSGFTTTLNLLRVGDMP